MAVLTLSLLSTVLYPEDSTSPTVCSKSSTHLWNSFFFILKSWKLALIPEHEVCIPFHHLFLAFTIIILCILSIHINVQFPMTFGKILALVLSVVSDLWSLIAYCLFFFLLYIFNWLPSNLIKCANLLLYYFRGVYSLWNSSLSSWIWIKPK